MQPFPGEKMGYFCIFFKKTDQRKESPDGRKCAQSGHPARLSSVVSTPSARIANFNYHFLQQPFFCARSCEMIVGTTLLQKRGPQLFLTTQKKFLF
jgi:hypothetical protein